MNGRPSVKCKEMRPRKHKLWEPKKKCKNESKVKKNTL